MNVFVLLNKGFEEIEALTIVDYLRRAEIEVKMVSVNNTEFVEGGHGIVVKSDLTFSEVDTTDVDLIYIPGGMPAAEILSNNKEVTDFINKIYSQDKIIASMCAGPMVLEKSGILSGHKVTSYPGFDAKLGSQDEYLEDEVVVSKNIITSRGPATAVFLALELIKQIKGKDISEKIASQILAEYIRKWFIYSFY